MRTLAFMAATQSATRSDPAWACAEEPLETRSLGQPQSGDFVVAEVLAAAPGRREIVGIAAAGAARGYRMSSRQGKQPRSIARRMRRR